MSELMKSGGWNPLAGCWPLLIQMPIFSALYYAISRTEEIRTSSFLWVNLGHADPYHILPIIAALTTFIQMKVFQSNITPGEQVQIFKDAANYDAGNDSIYGVCGAIRTCVVLDNR